MLQSDYRLRAIFEPALNWKDWKTPDQRRVSLATPEQRERAKEVEARAAEAQAVYDAKEAECIRMVFERELRNIPESLRLSVAEHPAF